MADRSNATQALNATSYTTQVNQVQQVRIYIEYQRKLKTYNNDQIVMSFNYWHT